MRSGPQYPRIEEVFEEESKEHNEDYDQEIDTNQLHKTITTPAPISDPRPLPYNPQSLAIYNPELSHQANAVPTSIKQQVKQSDDSQTAFGEPLASSFGHRKFAPIFMTPSAPPLEDKDWEEYQTWMNAPTFADRKAFPNHQRWNDILSQNQECFRINPSESFKDTISEKFRDKILEEKESALLNGHGLPPTYHAMIPFAPVEFDAQIKHSDSSSAAPRYIDQVQDMMDFADENHKMSHMKAKFVGQRIANNHFLVVSDHGGKITGKKLQIWGAGAKESLSLASANAGQSLGKVEGSKDAYEATTDYAHVPNRFTIIRITNNEMGFVFNRAESRIEKMSIGRYVIPENDYAYIGKTKLEAKQENALAITHHPQADDYIKNLATQLQVVLVTPGNTAFVKDNLNTYMLPENPEPYVLDKRRGEQFINYANKNQQIIRASDNSYTQYNQLQPGQFVTFQHDGKVIVWQYDEDEPELNSLYLRANHYLTDNKIHSTNENQLALQNTNVINTIPGQVVVVQNKERQIRFIEANKAETFVLRSPWQFIGFTNKNENDYRAGLQENGNQTTRLMLRSSEWVAVLNQSGHLSFYPPRMDGQPYYFSQPENTVIGIVDKNKPGEQKLEVPGIGTVSVVNIPSGQIGACRMRNMHFFLNPSPTPYIFMPPDAFLEMVDAKAAHTANGDLHRIVIAPDEHAVIIKDGELRLLPTKDASLGGQNGVYVFRAGQFSFEGGGPKKKSEQNCKLGPIHSVIVGVGEKGYGTVNNKLKIWDAGQHYIDNRKGEWFTDFFTTNVDPVEIKDLPVTFKHGITGNIDVFVSYHIDDPEKAIPHFKNHDTLHQFIQTTTSSEMLKLCASRPPLGYTDLDFSGNQVRSSDASNTSDASASEAVKEMQNSFMKYAETLKEKYGVSISDMYIHTWTLANDFVKQVQENAKALQNAHAEVAKAQIALQKAKLENQQSQQARENEIALRDLENKKLALQLEANRLQQVNESQISAAKKVADAKADGDVKIAAARALVDTAEQNALAATAGERAQTRAQKEMAENRLAAKKAETDAQLLEINAKKAHGEMEAEVAGKKEQARFAGLTSEQRLELQLAELKMQNMTNLLQLLTKANMQMPGVFTLDPKVLELYQMPAVAAAQRNSVAALSLFAAPQAVNTTTPALPVVEEAKQTQRM